VKEAEQLGMLRTPALKEFAIEYAKRGR